MKYQLSILQMLAEDHACYGEGCGVCEYLLNEIEKLGLKASDLYKIETL